LQYCPANPYLLPVDLALAASNPERLDHAPLWMAGWIVDHHRYDHTAMPNFRLSDSQIEAIIAYLDWLDQRK